MKRPANAANRATPAAAGPPGAACAAGPGPVSMGVAPRPQAAASAAAAHRLQMKAGRAVRPGRCDTMLIGTSFEGAYLTRDGVDGVVRHH